VHLLARSKGAVLEDALIEALPQLKGAYALVLLTPHEMIGIRDPHGLRPLCIGMLDGSYVFASETCALDLIQADYVREVEPGEIVTVDENGLRSLKPFPPVRPRFAYLSSSISPARQHGFGGGVYKARKLLAGGWPGSSRLRPIW